MAHVTPKGKGGARKGAGRKTNAQRLLDAGFVAPWFTQTFQEAQWTKLANSDDERIQLDALKYLSDRIYGKATERKEITGADGGALQAQITVEFVKPIS